MVGAMHDDQRFAKRGGIARIKGRVPLLVFLAESHHHNIGICDRFACAYRVYPGPFMIMPEFIWLGAQNFYTTIIAGGMVGNWHGKGNIHIGTARNNLIAPICMNFARKIKG